MKKVSFIVKNRGNMLLKDIAKKLNRTTRSIILKNKQTKKGKYMLSENEIIIHKNQTEIIEFMEDINDTKIFKKDWKRVLSKNIINK